MMGEPRFLIERLVLAIASLSWGCMIFEAGGSGRLSCCEPHPTTVVEIRAWMLMVAAMMLPTTTFAVRDVAIRSFRSRRLRAVLGYLSGYMTCWFLAGTVFLLIRLHPLAHDTRIAAALCLLSAFWAMLPARALWFTRCHRQIPLCPSGLRADLDTFHQGAFHGTFCVKMCWPLMFACGITGHDIVVMIGGAALAVSEKRMFRLDRKPLVLGALTLGVWVLVKWGMT
jgi:predicted metal-binding membrane protein